MSTMSMSGQTWLGAAASFLGMWIVMMAAMMLPSLVPTLWRYSQAGLSQLTTRVGVGYFAVWTAFGMVAYLLGLALPRATPIAVGVVVLLAGFFQFTPWKARHLACCREAPAGERDRTAWQHGLSLGLHCSQCCIGLMAILLVIGVMNVLAMAVVAAAITVERLAPAGERVARATGAVALGAGVFLIVRAAGLG
jgi:predicted metal-binding membrane protein